jgi:hypothetical protein
MIKKIRQSHNWVQLEKEKEEEEEEKEVPLYK